MGDMTDKAIGWVRQQKSLMPDKPFFAYFAPGATHAPHHVPKEWADKYAGQFDDGWDALRERTFARQKELGVIPQSAELTHRHEQIPAWDDMPEDLKPVLRRQMEIYAGFLEFADHHVGRLFDALEDLEVMDNTLVYYIIGDNGASAEGTLNGTFNEMINFNGAAAIETPEFMMERLDAVRRAGLLQPLRGRLGARDGHAVSVDQAGRLALRRHAQRHDRALAGRLRGEGRAPDAVRARHRRRADGARRRRPRRADVRARRPAGADPGREHALRLRRPGGRRTPRDAVLRDVRQPRHLPQGLDRRHAPQDALAARRRAGPRVRRRHLGALRHQRRLDAVRGRLGAASRAAARAAAAVPDRGDPQQRPAARRPRRGADPARDRRPAGARQGQPAAALRRHDPPVGELGRQHQEQVARGDGRDRRARGRRAGRDHRPGRQHRRLGPLHRSRASCAIATTCSASSASTSTATGSSRPARTRSGWSSTTPVPGSARAAP